MKSIQVLATLVTVAAAIPTMPMGGMNSNSINMHTGTQDNQDYGIDKLQARGMERIPDRDIQKLQDHGIEKLQARDIQKLQDHGIERLQARDFQRIPDYRMVEIQDRDINMHTGSESNQDMGIEKFQPRDIQQLQDHDIENIQNLRIDNLHDHDIENQHRDIEKRDGEGIAITLPILTSLPSLSGAGLTIPTVSIPGISVAVPDAQQDEATDSIESQNFGINPPANEIAPRGSSVIPEAEQGIPMPRKVNANFNGNIQY